MSNITQVINVDKNLRMLKKGVHASDMDQLLSSTGPYTLFAPSDLAFEKLRQGMMKDLLEPENKLPLTELMKNHIVDGKIYFKELKDGDKLKTVNGMELKVQVKDNVVIVGDVEVQAMGTKKISNGVIHLTDTVFGGK